VPSFACTVTFGRVYSWTDRIELCALIPNIVTSRVRHAQVDHVNWVQYDPLLTSAVCNEAGNVEVEQVSRFQGVGGPTKVSLEFSGMNSGRLNRTPHLHDALDSL
jgi:hypothetical protein